MSNPLIKPNDPRFQKPEVRDAAGQNRFGDGQPADGAQAAGDVFAAAGEERPYAPQYEAQQPARTRLLTTLWVGGWMCGLTTIVSLSGFFSFGWLLPLLGLVPTATAWLLAHEEMKAIRAGAIDSATTPRTRQAFWLGLLGLIFCALGVAAMVWRRMSFLPDVF